MENKIPTVSILMSVHNGEKYLEQTLQSITSQTYTDFEVIIINDCSTDQTSNILGKYKDNEKFKIINNESCLGLTKSLNIGISKARGKYIARLDADDIALPERLSIQKQFLDDNKDIVCIGSASIIIDENGNKTGFKKVVSNIDTLKFRMILANQISHPSAFFRTEIIKKIGGYNENYKYAQDFNLWSRLLKAGYKISNIEKPLILYRVHNKSISAEMRRRRRAQPQRRRRAALPVKAHLRPRALSIMRIGAAQHSPLEMVELVQPPQPMPGSTLVLSLELMCRVPLVAARVEPGVLISPVTPRPPPVQRAQAAQRPQAVSPGKPRLLL
jgi:GT2 family glycosyltransferase